MELEFIKKHWQAKLIRHSAGYSTLQDINLTSEAQIILEEIGLPIILPSEYKQSFLPFTFLQQLTVQDKDFYIIGDISLNLSGVTLLAINKDDGEIYQILKNHDHVYSYYFTNQSLTQFLLCLAYYNIFQDKVKNNTKSSHTKILNKKKEAFQQLKNTLIDIDEKAINDIGSLWGQYIEDLRLDIIITERDLNIPASSSEQGFPTITPEDLPF